MQTRWLLATLLTMPLVVAGCYEGKDRSSQSSSEQPSDGAAGGFGQALGTPLQAMLAMNEMLGTLAPSSAADTAAPTAEERAKRRATQLDERRAACGKVTLAGEVVTADFSEGCTFGPVRVVGVATIKEAKAAEGGRNGIELTTESFTINGAEFIGRLLVIPYDLEAKQFGLAFDYREEKGVSSAALNLKRDASKDTIGFDLMGSVALVGYTPLPATFALTPSVHYTLGACYPDGGSGFANPGTPLVFDTATPTTGIAYTDSAKTRPFRLPAYGACPGPGVLVKP